MWAATNISDLEAVPSETTEKIYQIIQLLPVDDIVCQLYIFSAFYGPLESYILSFTVWDSEHFFGKVRETGVLKVSQHSQVVSFVFDFETSSYRG